MVARAKTGQTREQLATQIETIRARLVRREREHREAGEELAALRHELNQLRALLRDEPPTE